MRLVLTFMFFAASTTIAAPINKCVGPDGRITFSQTSCSNQDTVERIEVRVQNSGMRLANEVTAAAQEGEGTQAPAPAVLRPALGQQGTCGANFSSQEIRKAIIEKRIIVGMTGKDARRAWGDPSTVNRTSHGDSQWVYDRGPGNTQYLYVNHNDCVTAWN